MPEPDLETARKLRRYLNPQWDEEREAESWQELLDRGDPLVEFYVAAVRVVVDSQLDA